MKKSAFLFVFFLFVLSVLGCAKIDDTIDYSLSLELTGNDYSKLVYLLGGVIDLENDSSDSWNTPLSTDAQKGRFIFNILNDNYMDKYENPEEAQFEKYYPVLEDSLIIDDCDVHDSVFAIDKNAKVAYKKEDIDKIMLDSFGGTLRDGGNILQDGMILSGNQFLLFSYLYYGSDLIGNKGRMTSFFIDNIRQASDKDIEVVARYFDDALEDGDDGEMGVCYLKYHISRNPSSFFGFSVNEYMFTGCRINEYYLAPDLPSQLIYGLRDGIYNDYVGLKRDFRSVEKSIDLNNDGVEEYFQIGLDSPNGTKILGIVGNVGYNFIYDFSGDFFDDYSELRNGLFVDVYFENLDSDENKEVIVAIGDKRNQIEANIYKINGDVTGFEKIPGVLVGKAYLEYYSDLMAFHAPYFNNGVCQVYEIINGVIQKISF